MASVAGVPSLTAAEKRKLLKLESDLAAFKALLGKSSRKPAKRVERKPAKRAAVSSQNDAYDKFVASLMATLRSA